MAWCKSAVTPLLTHWSYCSLQLSHWYDTLIRNKPSFWRIDPSSNFASRESRTPGVIRDVIDAYLEEAERQKDNKESTFTGHYTIYMAYSENAVSPVH